jgi:gluconokinase
VSTLTLPPLVVVMGISGVGKSVVGVQLAKRFDVPYVDGDDLHPQANVDKMQSGVPLTDEDRWPWLRTVGAWLRERAGSGGVVSCSALRRVYRDILVEAAPRTTFLHLVGDHDLVLSRMSDRAGHFMPVSLLESQLATLEPLQGDENGEAVDVTPPPAEIVEQFLARTHIVHPGGRSDS